MEELTKSLEPELVVLDPQTINGWLEENTRELLKHYKPRELRSMLRRKRCRSTRTI